jgi:exoribonuclease II
MSHQLHDDVGLALARHIAEGLKLHPEWITLAKNNLERWSEQNRDAATLLACYQEWRKILELPIETICTTLLDPTDHGQRLRQNSPFAGALPPAQVWRIKRQAHETSAA